MEEQNAQPMLSHQPKIDLEKLIVRISDISTLPTVVGQILEVVNRPDTSAEDLCGVVESDPMLTIRVMQAVQSVNHGIRNPIDRPKQAIAHLGFQRVRNIALAVSVCDLFKGEHQLGRYNRVQLWQHQVAVGAIARMIAVQTKVANPEGVFLAGLLHDIGIILEDQFIHERFKALMENYPGDTPLVDAESRCFGFSHATLGSRVAERWKLPEMVQDVIRLHHSETGYRGEFGKELSCVQLANVLCTLSGISSIGRKLVALSPLALQTLGLEMDAVRGLVEQVAEELPKYEDLMHLAKAG